MFSLERKNIFHFQDENAVNHLPLWQVICTSGGREITLVKTASKSVRIYYSH